MEFVRFFGPEETPSKRQVLLDCIQLLTVFGNMTFKGQMDSPEQISKLCCWLEADSIVGRSRLVTAPPLEMMEWKEEKVDHLWQNLQHAQLQLSVLHDEVPPSFSSIHAVLNGTADCVDEMIEMMRVLRMVRANERSVPN